MGYNPFECPIIAKAQEMGQPTPEVVVKIFVNKAKVEKCGGYSDASPNYEHCRTCKHNKKFYAMFN